MAFTIHWQVIEARRVAPIVGAARELGEFIAKFEADGWQAESDRRYGFTFMRRKGIPILVEATLRDPMAKSIQAFNPFTYTRALWPLFKSPITLNTLILSQFQGWLKQFNMHLAKVARDKKYFWSRSLP